MRRRVRLPDAEFDNQTAARCKYFLRRRGNLAVTIQPVVAAIECQARIEVANLRGERGDLTGRNMGGFDTMMSNGPRKAFAIVQATNLPATSRAGGRCRAP